MKYLLFGVALIFAALFVLSTMFGFIWQMTDTMQGISQDAQIALWTHLCFGVGLVGWIASTFALVLVDELDGVDYDDELDAIE